MEERGPSHSHTVGGNVSWYSCYGKQYGGSLRIEKELLGDPAIPLLSKYLENIKTLIRKDTCTPVFTTVLLTIAKIRPWTDEWIKI